MRGLTPFLLCPFSPIYAANLLVRVIDVFYSLARMVIRFVIIILLLSLASCSKPDEKLSVPVYSWHDDQAALVEDYGSMVALVHYRGDESGLPIEQAISDLAAWISNQEIKCYYYRPEPIDEEPLDDVLMVSFADSGSVMRERLITAIGEQQFSDEVLIVLREQLSIE